jgi:hypothetical protein
MSSAYSTYLKGLQLHIDSCNTKDGESANLRGGNSGFISEAGEVLGDASSCPRRAALRALSIDVDPTTVDNQIMFDGGLYNENAFIDRLKLAWDGEVISEEDTPTHWITDEGIPVTGRPDVVLLAKDGKPEIGVELKGVFSLWTARDILERRPKWNNLLQAAHYFYQLRASTGLNRYELLYISRSYYASNEMATRNLPNYGEKYSEYIDYRFYHWRPKKRGTGYTRAKATQEEYDLALAKGIQWVSTGEKSGRQPEFVAEAGNVRPFCISFELRWNEDAVLEWRGVKYAEEWKRSPITWAGIKRYYETAASLLTGSTKSLPPKPKVVKADGSPKGYDGCGYCPLNDSCKTARSWNDVVSAAKKIQEGD